MPGWLFSTENDGDDVKVDKITNGILSEKNGIKGWVRDYRFHHEIKGMNGSLEQCDEVIRIELEKENDHLKLRQRKLFS